MVLAICMVPSHNLLSQFSSILMVIVKHIYTYTHCFKQHSKGYITRNSFFRNDTAYFHLEGVESRERSASYRHNAELPLDWEIDVYNENRRVNIITQS